MPTFDPPINSFRPPNVLIAVSFDFFINVCIGTSPGPCDDAAESTDDSMNDLFPFDFWIAFFVKAFTDDCIYASPDPCDNDVFDTALGLPIAYTGCT